MENKLVKKLFKTNPLQISTILSWILGFGISLCILGIIFPINTLHIHNTMILGGLSIILVCYPIRFSIKIKKSIKDYLLLIFIQSLAINGFLLSFHLPYRQIFQILAIISFILWIIFEIHYQYKHKEPSVFTENLIYIISVTGIIIGVIFKIQHWPTADIIIVSSLIAAFILFIRSK